MVPLATAGHWDCNSPVAARSENPTAARCVNGADDTADVRGAICPDEKSSVTGWNSESSDFELRLDVSDALGGQSSSTLFVQVWTNPCPPPQLVC